MSKNLIYLCKNKLLGIDRILPILMEIKARHPNISITIIFVNDKQMEDIKRNHNIWKAIQLMDSHSYAIRSQNGLVTLFRLAKFILSCAFKNNIIIRNADVLPLHKITMKILRKISIMTEIKAYLSVQFSDYLRNINTQCVFKREKAGEPAKMEFSTDHFDYFL